MLGLLFAFACSAPVSTDVPPDLQPRSGSAEEALLEAPEATEPEAPFIRILNSEDCTNPCTLRSDSSTEVVEAWYEADGWFLGYASDEELRLEYAFHQVGSREITAFGLNANGEVIAEDLRVVEVVEPPLDWPTGSEICANYTSQEAEWAPVQTTGEGVPRTASEIGWQSPAEWTERVPFDGHPGWAAVHEGIDYVNNDSRQAQVPVKASADGVVAYVRSGCPQSTALGFNTANRECGAGWGNHVVVFHKDDTYTRYAHLEDGAVTVEVGDQVTAGEVLGLMGNSGRSDTRHLHFELGAKKDAFESCASAQSYDTVHDPVLLGL